YGAHHARAEFFAGVVGWVPVDPSFGLSDRSSRGLTYFVNDAGDQLVFHLRGDLVVETKRFGKASLVRLQGVAVWATGMGTFEKPERQEDCQRLGVSWLAPSRAAGLKPPAGPARRRRTAPRTPCAAATAAARCGPATAAAGSAAGCPSRRGRTGCAPG